MKKKNIKISLVLLIVCAFLFISCNTVANSDDDDDDTSKDSDDVSSISYTYQNSNANSYNRTYYAMYIVDGENLTLSDTTITVTGSNVIGVLVVNGGTATLTNCTINKSGAGSGESNEDAYNFYGVNNAVVVLGSSSEATLSGCTVKTTSEYANAVFASDDGTINITDGITATTTANSSRGLFASFGGKIYANNGGVNITTEGAHCAGLVTDRGAGTIIVGNATSTNTSTISTKQNDSPCVYSTGTITGYNITGTCTSGQAVVVEGNNTVNLTNCTMSGGRTSQGCIFMYQSTSGDAENSAASSSKSTLNITNCLFHAFNSADMFVITHTTAQITSSGCTFYADSNTTAFTASTNATQYLINCNTVNESQWGSGNYLNTFSTSDTLTGTVYTGDSTSEATITCGTSSNLIKASNSSGTITVNGSTL